MSCVSRFESSPFVCSLAFIPFFFLFFLPGYIPEIYIGFGLSPPLSACLNQVVPIIISLPSVWPVEACKGYYETRPVPVMPETSFSFPLTFLLLILSELILSECYFQFLIYCCIELVLLSWFLNLFHSLKGCNLPSSMWQLAHVMYSYWPWFATINKYCSGKDLINFNTSKHTSMSLKSHCSVVVSGHRKLSSCFISSLYLWS